MSWPNHVQILSFASVASRQGAVKYGFVCKIAGGCSSYDVIAPWPDLTGSIFCQKLRKVCPIRYPKTWRRYAPLFFRYLWKTSGGVAPLSGRGLTRAPELFFITWDKGYKRSRVTWERKGTTACLFRGRGIQKTVRRFRPKTRVYGIAAMTHSLTYDQFSYMTWWRVSRATSNCYIIFFTFWKLRGKNVCLRVVAVAYCTLDVADVGSVR